MRRRPWGRRPPSFGGVDALEDFPWSKWCAPRSVARFVVRLTEAWRSRGVLLYCKEGANRSGAAAVAVSTYMTGAPLAECVAHVEMLRKIVDLSGWTDRLQAMVDQFPSRDDCHAGSCLSSTSAHATHRPTRAPRAWRTLRVPRERDRGARGVGFSINRQKIKPGPLRATARSETLGRTRERTLRSSTGGCIPAAARLGGASGMPFAVVETAEPYDVTRPQPAPGWIPFHRSGPYK